MKNAFERRGDVLVVFVLYRGERYEVLADWEDFAKVKRFTWRFNKGRHSPYCVADRPGRNYRKKVWMHKLVLGAGAGCKVDHRNHCGLDNRKSNLRQLNYRLNALHMRRALESSMSGIRGVSFDERRKKWRATLQWTGKRRHLGYFLTDVEADDAVKAELERRGIGVHVPTAEEYERAEEASAIAQRMGGAG